MKDKLEWSDLTVSGCEMRRARSGCKAELRNVGGEIIISFIVDKPISTNHWRLEILGQDGEPLGPDHATAYSYASIAYSTMDIAKAYAQSYAEEVI